MNADKMKIDRIPNGTVRVPSSKSVGHRALICAALAGGEKALEGVSGLDMNDDLRATKAGILKIIAGDRSEPVDCGESGSTLRFLIPVAAAFGGEWTFTGRGRLMERPLDIYKDVFESHGGFFRQDAGTVAIRGRLTPGRYELPGDVSSQFITGLLLALPLLNGESEIVLTAPLESANYVDLTLDVMNAFGVDAFDGEGGEWEVMEITTGASSGPAVSTSALASDAPAGWRVPGGQVYKRAKYAVEGDWSQAAFFLCAGALGARVSVEGLSPASLQGDMRILSVLKSMGADVDATLRPALFARKRSCTIRAFLPQSGLKGITIDVSHIPDLVPPIAALACFAAGTTRITGASRLRLKESDRIAALVTELGKLGADISADGGDIIIRGRERLDGGEADAWNDHRIAMALAVASVGCTSPVYLTGAESVGKSYPKFWDDFLRIANPNIKEAAS
ncbi:MAG: 3-phosphoshikimate 1-carboxyvinyltransferase [Clostridiales Family XIII bacterium]|jgi:3-phosphoshikimate 1-carboxyvinyltransferase|nr:3-phosphoshikimate 1-carboxyvinyltransferase [Clostridiales Family XIII bacterium]